MTGALLAVVVAAAFTGAGTAYLLWVFVVPLLVPKPTPDPAATAMPSSAVPQAGAAGDLPQVPHFPDPSLTAQVAAVRTDMAALARAQIAMLEGMAERENQLLQEMRAVATARDPELITSLQRIEARLSGRPPPDNAQVLDETDPAPATSPPVQDLTEEDDDPATTADNPDARPNIGLA